MCHAITKKGRICIKSSIKNSKFCHIHQPKLNPLQIINLYSKEEELNNIIIKNKLNYDKLYKQHIINVDDHNKLLKTFNITKEVCLRQDKTKDNLKQEIKNLNKTIEKKNLEFKKLQNEFNKFKSNNKDKLDLINTVQQYELKKKELENQNIDILYYNDAEFQKARIQRNVLIHEKLITV